MLVGLGSTEKLGTGNNVQDKLMAVHHLDVPWTPAAIEQRDGRVWRHGNENKEISIHRYVAEGSLDQALWQIVANKARFIGQVITSGAPERNAREDDTEEISAEMFSAIASGDPRFMEKVNLAEEVKQLHYGRQRHEREQVRFREKAEAHERSIPVQIETAKALRADAAHLEANPDFSMTIAGQTHTERKAATEALEEFQKNNAERIAADRSRNYPMVALRSHRGMDVNNGAAASTPSPDPLASSILLAKRCQRSSTWHVVTWRSERTKLNKPREVSRRRRNPR